MWMAMEAVLMKHLSIVLTISWLSVMVGQVVTQASQPPGICYEVYGDDWSCNNPPNIVCQDAPCSRNRIVNCPCQPGFIRLSSGKCYLFSFQTRTWQDALANCQSVGATLAYPASFLEDTVLANYLRANSNGLIGWWLDGLAQAQQVNWIWAHNNASLTYFDWTQGQPPGPSGSQRCLQYSDNNWQWNSKDCNSRGPFVCQEL